MVESDELAAQVIEFMDEGVQPENSYRVVLEPYDETREERLVWITEVDGEAVRYYCEPEAGFWRRLGTWFIGLFPIEHHL